MKLSVCMIVKNEESCLEKCLESVKDADEIVILDTGSTDKTSEIARKFTTKYYENEYKWEDSFCKARNKALEKVTGDWVLSIDADERLMLGGIEGVNKEIAKAEKNNKRTISCLLIYENMIHESYFPKVYKKDPKIFYHGDVHNYLTIDDKNRTNIKIYCGKSRAHTLDPDRSLRILKKSVGKNPNLVREVYYLAREYWYRKDYITALYWYNVYLKRSYWSPEKADAYLTASRCLFNLGRGEEARDYCLQAIKLNANFKEALEFMARLSGPGNAKRWKEFSKTASNESVLFIRSK